LGGSTPSEAPAGSASVPTEVKETKRNPGGARREFHPEDLVIEAARLLYVDGLVAKTQAELRKASLDAYSSTLPEGAKQPSDDWAKPIIRKLWSAAAMMP
jgi:hypothetical protein